MIVCPSCQTQNMDGTFFCTDCGSSFLPSRLRDTTASLGVPAATASAAPFAPPPAAIPAPDTSGPTLRVVILNSGRKLGFNTAQPILIGRQDSARSFHPDIDLSTDGGLDAGVSRRHARITMSENVCFIEDLNSSNGTYVNKSQVAPGKPKQIQHGDEVRMGNILIRIEITN